MHPMDQFERDKEQRVASYCNESSDIMKIGEQWINAAFTNKYMYNFTWMGLPVIQFPEDIVAMQEIMWKVKPDLVIETGIAHGGSLIMYASFMEMMGLDKGHVLGIDIDIRAHNRAAIEAHPMASRIQMIQGSSIAPEIIEQVRQVAKDYKRILVCLDSNHTHDHVLAELEAYAPLTSVGSYCVVFDTIIEDMPADMFPDRPWGPGNNPMTAVHEFLGTHSEFEIDKNIQNKLLITAAPDGYLRRAG